MHVKASSLRKILLKFGPTNYFEYFIVIRFMQVQLRYQNETHDFQFPSGASVSSLMEVIARQFSIPPENQKIICKGKPLSAPFDPLVNGSKILLMASSILPQKVASPASATNRNSYPQSINSSIREDIFKMAPPNGVTKSHPFQSSILPNEPLHVVDEKGKVVDMFFESDALFFRCDEYTERIFFAEIRGYIQQDHPHQIGYFSLGLQIPNKNKWVYFVPSQYKNLVSSIIRK